MEVKKTVSDANVSENLYEICKFGKETDDKKYMSRLMHYQSRYIYTYYILIKTLHIHFVRNGEKVN